MNNHNGRILLLYGEKLPRELITSSLMWILLRPLPLYLIDGANEFDGYGLIRLIRQQGRDPGVILKQLHLSRAFTCYQLAERVMTLTPLTRLADCFVRQKASRAIRAESRHLSPFEEGEPRGHSLYLLGMLDTFYDENVPFAETWRLLNHVLAHVQQLRAGDARIVIATKLPPAQVAPRAAFVQRLKECADVVYRLKSTGAAPVLVHEKAN